MEKLRQYQDRSNFLDNSSCNIKTKIIITQQRKRQPKRLAGIRQTNNQIIYQNFVISDADKSEKDVSFIIKSLSEHFTFSSLMENKALEKQLIDKFRLCAVSQGEYLMRQHDNASSFFILKQGQMAVFCNSEKIGSVKIGNGIGELALLYSKSRSASILATKDCKLWFIDRKTFKSTVSSIIQQTFSQNKKFIESCKFFYYLTGQQKVRLASISLNQKYQKGAIICQEGLLASSMFIIKTGRLRRQKYGKNIGFYYSGDSLQEYAALQPDATRKETIIADQTTEVLAFASGEIEKILGSSLQKIIFRNYAKSKLQQDENLKMLATEIQQKIIDCFKVRQIQKGQQVFLQRTLCKNKIVFVVQGQYEIQNGHKMPIYGTKCLKAEHQQAKHKCSCVFLTNGKVAETTLNEMENKIGSKIEVAIQKSQKLKKNIQVRRSKLIDFKNLSQQFELKDFYILKKLGEGQFGQVFLVSYRQSTKLFALKCISKTEAIKYKIQKHLINQKKVLQSHSCSFTVDFIRSFKDANYIYFLTQFINGIELFDALRIIGIVPPILAKIYTSIILYALQSFHNNNIVYRDLKPENVMVDADGYLKIIDMGTCKNLKASNSNKTFTIIGTPHYMAPEVLSGKGYGFSVDLWSLGVMIYQFLAGHLPFGQNCQDCYQVYKQVLQNPLVFPNAINDPTAKHLICQLLNRNSECRLGSSFSELKNHEFFKEIDWDLLLEKNIIPEFRPPKSCLARVDYLLKHRRPIDDYLKQSWQNWEKQQIINKWDEYF